MSVKVTDRTERKMQYVQTATFVEYLKEFHYVDRYSSKL